MKLNIIYVKYVCNGRSGGTVGAVGMDSSAHFISCTSTGGVTGKMKGRVGDTPIPGLKLKCIQLKPFIGNLLLL